MMKAITARIIVCTSLLTLGVAGCSSLPPKRAEFNPQSELVRVHAQGDKHLVFGTTWGDRNRGTYALLQSAAEATLRAGYSRFSIQAPNTLAAASINTAQEFVDQCRINYLNMLTYNRDPCRIHESAVDTTMLIRVYEEPPLEYLTFDAAAVLDYMKENDLYDVDHSLEQFTEARSVN